MEIVGDSLIDGNATVITLTANSFVYTGTGGLLQTTAAPTNGQLVIGSTGAAPVLGSITGTANQITVTNGAGSITLAIATNPIWPGTASETIPSGTVAQRPGSPTAGMLRFNTDDQVIEGYTSPYTILTTPVALQRSTMNRKRRWLTEDFISGPVTSTNGTSGVGNLSWTYTNSSGNAANVFLTPTADHPGVISLVTGGANANNARLHLGNSATATIILANQVEYFAFLIMIPTITTVVVRAGLFGNMTTTASGITAAQSGGGAWFVFDSSVSATTLQFIVGTATTLSAAVNTATVSAGGWLLCEAFYNGTSWTPVVNGTTYTAVSTNVPTSTVQPGVTIGNLAGASRTLNFDMFSMYTTELGNRYP